MGWSLWGGTLRLGWIIRPKCVDGGWLGLDFGMGGRDVWSYLTVCCGKEREKEKVFVCGRRES